MPSLLTHPVARVVAATAAVGSLTDWTLFATLVVTVDDLLGGSPWATALVLVVRILPSVVLAPLAARRVDGRDLRSTLIRHELLRAGAVAGLAAAFVLRSIPGILVALLVLEFAAAMQAAARESVISRHVPRRLFTAMNTATAVLAYGLLPVGPLVVAAVGAPLGWVASIGGALAMTAVYAMALRLGTSTTTDAAVTRVPGSTAEDRSWRRVTIAAALGVLPAVALFAVGPTLAEGWIGDGSATGPLYGAVLAGGAVGFALANLLRLRADVAMVLAAVGLVVAASGSWVAGLGLLGVGAGAAYLDLQTRLQHIASDPSQFAAAFAILKVASGVAVLGAPALASIAPARTVLLVGGASALVGAMVASPVAGRALQVAVREALHLLARLVIRVDVVDHAARIEGPVVVVSNHPHWLDGVAALLADRRMRPVARWQRNLGARVGIWAADAVVTTARTPLDPRPAFTHAAAHLQGGGRIWLAPEGGSHADPQLRAPRSGAVRMAHLARVPIQPLAIHWLDDPAGPHLHRWRPWSRRVVRLTWGTPVTTTGDVAADNHRMMRALATVTGLRAPEPGLAA